MTRREAKEKATLLVNKMSVEEAASQLRYDAPEVERLNIPEYNWWSEGLHGVARAGTATVFPQAIALGATFDNELLEQVGDVISTEARAKYNELSKHGDRDIYKGLTLWSPNINIFRDPRWGRGHETYGEDPFLTGKLGVSFIEGLQGEKDDVSYLKIAACAKHFAVHSGPEALRHHFDAVSSQKDLWETYLPAFEACVKDAKVESVMGAYNRTNGEPCCANKPLMQDILVDKWKFEGHFVSDCWAVRDFHENHHVTDTPEDSAALALKTGCDLNCGCTYQKIMNAYIEGKVTEEDIRKAAVHLFTTRYMLGMFEETPYDQIPYEKVECKEHLAIAQKASEESIVLLKNDKTLPIDTSKVKTIGVIGPNADSRKAMMGNYYGTSSRYITVLEGIQDAAGEDVRVFYSEGCHLFNMKPDPLSRPQKYLSEAEIVAEHSDLVVLCLGLDETLEGEEGDAGNAYASGDKKDLALPECQLQLLDTIIKTKTPYILCMMAGSSIDMIEASKSAAAILQVWYPGARGGKTVADILFGNVSPSGKLPITLYKDLEGFPEFTDYSMKGRTYRYLDREPLYPFGYGLTYGDTKVNKVTGSVNDYKTAAKDGIQLSVEAVNDSDVAVSDVLQVYIHVDGTDNEVKNFRLCGFKRIQMKAHETCSITVDIDAKAFLTVDENGNSNADGNGASLYVGFGQPDHRTEELTGHAAVCCKL